jgi:hypothetical protein
MSPSPTRRRKRPHPARRARRRAGWLSIVAMAGLTGCMAAATRTATSAATGSAARAASTATSTSPTTASSDDDTWSTHSAAAPTPGSVSSQPVTSSHAS